MKISAPFAGPISFPLLVARDRGLLKGYELSNYCEDNKLGEVVLDSITNIWKVGNEYKVRSGVFINMYSIIGRKDSDVIYTVKKGTLADYNARLYAMYHRKEVVNTTPEDVVRKAKEGFMGIVGNEVKVGDPLEEELMQDGILVPSCLIAFKVEDPDLLKLYDEGIRIIQEDPISASSVISRESKYYDEEVMKRIISLYRHRRSDDTKDLMMAISIYSKVEGNVSKIKIANS